MSVQQLAEELQKPIRKSKKRKVHSPFIDNIMCNWHLQQICMGHSFER